MKNSVFKIFVTIILIIDIFAITFLSQISSFLNFQQNIISLPINPNTFKSKEQILLSQMSLEEKIGQMFIVGFTGNTLSSNIEDLIKNKNIGGVILYHYNIDTAEQTTSLISSLQKLSKESGSDIPLFISVDQEGGVVSRIKFDNTYELTGQPDIETAKQAYAIGKSRGEELSELGVNMNFSPVLDFAEEEDSFLYNRVFRGNREFISELASRMVDGYSDSNIIAVVKHFPGHPDNTSDSHNGVPVVDCTYDELSSFLSQFINIISNSNLRAIMTAHVLYPNIDADNPATVSRTILTDHLKRDLKYKGIIITDDLEMKSISDVLTPAESAVKAVIAGNDILMFSSTYDSQIEAYDALLIAVQNGQIEEERIDESVIKLLRVKSSLANR